MDRHLVVSVLAAVGALAAGVAAAILGAAELSVIAGMAGVVAGIAAAAIAARARSTEDRLHGADDELRRLQRELNSLDAALRAEVSRHDARNPLADGTFDVPADGTGPPLFVAPDDAIDPVSGLLDEKLFPVVVHQRVAAARRLLQPVSVALLEVDGMANADPSVRNEVLGVLGEVLRHTLRECDTSCRVGNIAAAAVLENTAESGAVWAVERVRGVLLASPVDVNLTVSAGIACYPTHALGAQELLERAHQALAVARTRGTDHVEVAGLD